MSRFKGVSTLVFSVFLGSQAGAENLLQGLKHGAEKVGSSIEKGLGRVGESIDSTVDLVTNEATPEETRAELDQMADEVIERLTRENQDAAILYEISAGYAVFDTRKVTIMPVTAGYGRGVAISREDESETYMNMGTGGVGAALGIGGFESQIVILFETPGDFLKFINDGYDATAESGAMFGEDKTGEEIRFIDGRSVFVLTKKGWRVAADATGTKYWRSPELN
ncbi:MAG: hypothetical protein AB3N15_07090 [Paracoccaceae bacterium]